MNEDQKHQKLHSNVSFQKTHTKIRQNISEYVKEYKEIIDCQATINFDEIIGKLLKNKIDFDPTKSQRRFQFRIIPFEELRGFFKVNIQWGEFDIDLVIAQMNTINPFRSQQGLKGKFGQVYFTQFQNVQIAVKSFAYGAQQILWKMFPNILKQLSIFKICSSLMCAPALSSHFGFDLVIYNDCVQYACQKGEPINQISSKNQKQLMDCLSIIHSFRIVHGDIKPENIVFSKQLKKCVFIDFGFSQIINERLGFKTISQFRGTPQYCINQMVQLLVKSQQQVDLYYNDAFGFSKTVQALSEFQQMDIVLRYQGQFDYKRNDQWIFMSFCCYYLKKDYFNAGDILQYDKQFLISNISVVLSFILKTISISFSWIFFNASFKDYKNHKIYKKIEKRTKNNLFGLIQLRNQQLDSQKSSFSNQANSNLCSIFPQNKFSYYLKIFLEDSSTLQNLSKEIILKMAFQCIRFDTPNTSLKNKHRIAVKINCLILDIKSQNTNSDELQNEQFYLREIRIFLLQLLKQCYRQPFQNWKKDLLLDIVYQSLLISLQLSSVIEQFFKFCRKHYSSDQQKILVIVQMYHWIYFLKQQDITINHKEILTITYKMAEFIQAQQRNIMNLKQDIQQSNILFIFSLLKKQQTSTQIYQILKHLIQKTKNPRLRYSLRFIMTSYEMQSNFAKGNVEKIYQILQSINTNIDCLRSSLHTCIYLNTKTMVSFSNVAELQSYDKYINNIIRCKLVKQNCHFLYDKINRSVVYTKNIVKLVCQNIELCSNWITMERFVFIVTLQLYHQQQIDQATKHRLVKLSKYLKPFILTRMELTIGLQILYFLVYLRLYLQYLFYCIIGENTQWPLDQNKYSMAKHRYDVNTQKFLQIEKKLVDYYKCRIEGDTNKLVKCMEGILDFCNCNSLINLKFQFIYQFVNIPSQRDYILERLFIQCKKDNYYFYYFRPETRHFAVQTIITLVEKNEQLVYELLRNLIQFIKQHQFNSYLLDFLKIIQGLVDKQNLKEYFRLEVLKKQFKDLLNDNPYSIGLLMISLNWTQNPKTIQQILKLSAKHFNYTNFHFRRCFIESYYKYYLFLDNEHRKKKYIACRIALKLQNVENQIFSKDQQEQFEKEFRSVKRKLEIH